MNFHPIMTLCGGMEKHNEREEKEKVVQFSHGIEWWVFCHSWTDLADAALTRHSPCLFARPSTRKTGGSFSQLWQY